jgi:hypothetical protein
MNDGMYTNIRNYLEEIACQGRQIIAGQQRTNELLERITTPTLELQGDKKWTELPVDKDGFVIAPAVADETGQQVFTPKATIVDEPKRENPKPPFTVETVKEEPLKTTETVEVVDDKPTTATEEGQMIEWLQGSTPVPNWFFAMIIGLTVLGYLTRFAIWLWRGRK